MGEPLEPAKSGVDDVGAFLVQRLREEGAEDDVGRDMGHHRVDIDRLCPIGGVEPGEQIVGGGDHQRHGPIERSMGEGGIDHRPLAFPILAIGGEDRIADQRIEIADQFAMLGEGGAALEDLVDQRQFVGDIHGLTRHADLAHLHRIALVEEHMDPAVPATQEALDEAAFRLGRLRIRGREGRAHGIVRKAATASSTVRRPAVRLTKSSGDRRSPTLR